MTIKVDARGLSCPAPVIRTKEALEKAAGEDVITIVDNQAAKENVRRLAEKMSYTVTVKEDGGDYYLSMAKSSCSCAIEAVSAAGSDVILIAGDKMGEGEEELGRILMKGFFYALTQIKPFPETLIFLNSGVRLTTEGSESLENIKLLKEQGVEILSCGTCLDYYKLKDKLAVGEISNMYTIVEKLSTADKVVRI